MNFSQGDILIRKNNQSDTVWVRQRLVTQVTEVSNDTLKSPLRVRYKKTVQPCHRHHSILPDTGKGWRWAKINGDFYYDLARIPDRKPTYYRSQFGDAEELVRQYNEAVQNKSKGLFESQFKTYVKSKQVDYLPCYHQYTALQAKALAKACAVLEFIIIYTATNDDMK